MTHHDAILLHEPCVNFLQRMALEADGFVAPLGAGYTSEKEYDECAVQAWQATRELFPERDFAGNHLEAITAHWESELLDREAAVEAAEEDPPEPYTRTELVVDEHGD